MNGNRYATIFGALVYLLAGLLPAGGATPAIDSFDYSSETSARSAWKPMRGSAEVSPAERESRACLRMPCNFAGTEMERASWDRQVTLDLSAADGIAFELYTRNASPVSYFSIYFQSGDGWYHGSFFPETSDGWKTVTIRKSAMGTEGRPGGWDRVKTIRISAWRGTDVDTEFFLSNLRSTGVLGADALVAIVRGDSASSASPKEARALREAADRVSRALERSGVRSVQLSDEGLSASEIKQARLVVLPYNPTMTPESVEALQAYIKAGGRVLAFYAIPASLYAPLGIQTGDFRQLPEGTAGLRIREQSLPEAPRELEQRSWNARVVQPIPGRGRVIADWLDANGKATDVPALVLSTNCAMMTHILLNEDVENQARLVLALAGALAPEIARQAAAESISNIGQVASYGSADEALSGIRKLGAGNRQVEPVLRRARDLRDTARRLYKQDRSLAARDAAERAQAQLLEAFCLAQRSQPGEFRAFWCHSAFGVRGLSWDAALQRLAENGFTAILPNMLWGGAAFYDSDVLPVAAAVKERGDQIRECVAAARKYGLQVHVWKVNWNLGSAAPKEFVERMGREGRLQVSSSGQEERWLCPSHPENQQLEIASMVEVARKYDVNGIHFDYIRYPGNDHCFCPGCRERFERSSEKKIAQWPRDVLRDGVRREEWLGWRRSHITGVVRSVADQARAVKPNIKISAAVFRNWPSDRDSVGQDWKVWCDEGWLDFVCPMDYTPSNSSFENMVTKQIAWAGKVPCYPGIGFSASNSRFGPDRAIEQIMISRKHRTGGFVIFNYGVNECENLVPLLGKGITRTTNHIRR